MIDVKRTITSTIKDKIDKLRKLAVNDTKAFKKILYLIIMDDLLDWSAYLDAPETLQMQLKKARVDFILLNTEFVIERFKETYTDLDGNPIVIKQLQPYVNVNTPQTTDTWKRVWDAPSDTIFVAERINPIDAKDTPWDLDTSCQPELIYYQNVRDVASGKTISGPPNNIDKSQLTICEKMNVYVNRETGEIYTINNETDRWELISGGEGEMTEARVKQIIKDNRQGIVNSLENNVITHTLTEDATNTADMPITDKSELEDLL